jgi:hypothetical protein
MADRQWLVTELQRRLATPLTNAGIQFIDDPGQLKEPLDDALLMFGFDEAVLATAVIATSDQRAVLALARWTALQAAKVRLADQFDITVLGNSYRLKQQTDLIDGLIAQAEADLVTIFGGIPSVVESATGVVIMDLGYLNPAPPAAISYDGPYTTLVIGAE